MKPSDNETEVQENLRDIRCLRLEEDMLNERIARLESAMQRCTTSPAREGSGVTSQQDRLAAQLALKEELEDKLRACALDAARAQLDVCTMLEGLPPGQQEVMALRYIKGLPWSQVAHIMNYGKRHCFKMHEAALKALSHKQKEDS